MDIELWKQRKKELRLTFDELAERSKVSRRQLLYLFNGDGKNAGIDTVQKIERALGLEQEKSPTDELSEGEKQLIELIKQMTDEEATELSNYIDFIISKRKQG